MFFYRSVRNRLNEIGFTIKRHKQALIPKQKTMLHLTKKKQSWGSGGVIG